MTLLGTFKLRILSSCFFKFLKNVSIYHECPLFLNNKVSFRVPFVKKEPAFLFKVFFLVL